MLDTILPAGLIRAFGVCLFFRVRKQNCNFVIGDTIRILALPQPINPQKEVTP
jgi:hypothetical protein